MTLSSPCLGLSAASAEREPAEPIDSAEPLAVAYLPDVYEFAPYNDNASTTTQNFLLPGDMVMAPEVQDHTLDTVQDIDWGIAFCPGIDLAGNPAPIPFSLRLFDLSIPPAAGIRVYVYENGPDQPPTKERDIGSGQIEEVVGWSSTGYRWVYFRVSSLGDIGDGVFYRVDLTRNTGNNNGILAETGPQGVSVGFPMDGAFVVGTQGWLQLAAPTIVGYNVYRAQSIDQYTVTDYQQVNPTPIAPEAYCLNCGDLIFNGAVSQKCYWYLDRFSSLSFELYIYRIKEVHADTSEEWMDAAPITVLLNPYAIQPTRECVAPTATPSPSPTPPPTPSTIPSPTETSTPLPTASPTVSPTPTARVTPTPLVPPSGFLVR